KVVLSDAARLEDTYASIIKDELNLKQVTLIDAAGVDAASYGISQQLVVNARAAGPRLGKNVQQAIKGAKSGDWSVADGVVTAGGLELVEGEYTLDTVVNAEADIAAAVIDGGFLVLDTEVTEELAAEGIARDMVRSIQAARKDADLQVSDRIRTTISANETVIAALEANRELISGETLTVDLVLQANGAAKEPQVK